MTITSRTALVQRLDHVICQSRAPYEINRAMGACS